MTTGASPRANPVPRAGALALRERRVEHRGRSAELAAQLPREDGSQRDLGDEPDGPRPSSSAAAMARR